MIAFNCTRCGKGLIVPNALAGTRLPCSSCEEMQAVPLPRAPVKRRWFWALAASVGIAVVLAVGWRVLLAKRPALVRERLANRLRILSPRWSGVDWQICDPKTGQYQLQAFYATKHATYTLALTRSVATNHSSVRVDPHGDRWLALALFYKGELESFKYQGTDPVEKTELLELANDLDEALTQALP